MPAGSGDLTFRPLRKDDLSLLCDWLNAPHMRAFYQKTPISRAEVEAKFGPRIRGDVPTHDHIALLNGRPLGKLQCYRNVDHPSYAYEIGLKEGISIDYFIGDPASLRRGLGRAMLRDYIDQIAFPLHGDETRCFICHDIENAPARACSRATGFRPLRDVLEAGIPSELLVLEREP
jgi:aminoglycoside 6'-N-acetyltransferase